MDLTMLVRKGKNTILIVDTKTIRLHFCIVSDLFLTDIYNSGLYIINTQLQMKRFKRVDSIPLLVTLVIVKLKRRLLFLLPLLQYLYGL